MSTVDPQIVRIAERRFHLVTDDEIQRLGRSPRDIRRWIETRQLHRVAPNVLSTSAAPYDVPQRELALCLSLPAAVLSHASAAAIWRFRRAPRDRLEVTVPKGTRIRDHAALVHYSNRMPAHHVVDLIDGARVTTVARTVFDLGGVLPQSSHLSIIEDVRNKRLCTDAEIGEVYDDLCGRGRRGSAAWMRLITLVERATRPTMSDLELDFQEALVAAGLPPAVQQHAVVLPNGRTVHLDLAYPAQRLDIEVDHNEWHATPTAVIRDKERDLGLALLGWERLRFPDMSIERNLRRCVAVVRAILDQRTALLASAPPLRPTAE